MTIRFTLEQIAASFVATARRQWRFCIPGTALRAQHLLEKHPAPTLEYSAALS